ncbi:MAG: glycosyltransferase family 39 protein [Candidatus Accumulibacter sp.]|uniref:Glycosyltransferase family 39 protein n=1 Tax=Candidatus Accumulibacter affinis TaxID=2954384 RepID=A0A935T5Q3_9PROT|nr:glycosyltransferase family 39 protein [Candidatus Accumulibacter affinis]
MTRVAVLSRFVDTRSALPVILVAAVWLAATAGIRPLMLADEGRYVGIAWEMLTSGDWLVPRLDGMPFFHKPPLFYWLSALSLSVFGVHELPARAASLLAATFAAAGLYLFIRRYRNSQVATLTVVILLTQPIFYAGAQFANLDMLVAGLISLTVLAGAEAVLRLEKGLPHRPALARMYALAALGVLAKGLIGIVLPAGVLFFWLLWRRSWRLIAAMLWLPGFLLLGLIALPWFFWMQHSYPGFFDYFVVYHHFRRFSETGFNNQLAFWFYVPLIFLGALPWSPWLARVFHKTCRADPGSGDLRSLMVIWLVLIVVFFSLPSSKLIGYILPAIPPLAYLIAETFSLWLERDRLRAQRWYAGTLGLAALACIALVIGVALADKVSARPLASRAAPAWQPEDQLVMLDEYQYDLPFYLRASKPAWVVSDWDDPEIPRRDNWRKELLDASEFDRHSQPSALLTIPQLAARLCNPGSGVVWIWGRPRASRFLPWLEDQPIFASDEKHVWWRVEPAALRAHCPEMPRND